MLNFMDLARAGDQVIGVHLEMKRLGICPFSVEKLLFHCFETHCLTKIFLCPLQASLFLQFCSGLSFWAAASLICSKAGEAYGIRERERGRFFMRQTRGGVCRLHKQIARYASPEER